MNQENKICCPEFKPDKWENKTFNWQKKLFIKESLPTFFHLPWPPLIGKKITRLWQAAEAAGATEANKEEVLILFHDPSPFKSEIYLSVTQEVPERQNVTLSGIFTGKVYDGGYQQVPKFIKEMNQTLRSRGQQARDYYIHYAYCPQCAKKFGHNYMLLLAELGA